MKIYVIYYLPGSNHIRYQILDTDYPFKWTEKQITEVQICLALLTKDDPREVVIVDVKNLEN